MRSTFIRVLLILAILLTAGCSNKAETKTEVLITQPPPTVPVTVIEPTPTPTPTPEIRIQSGDLAILEADSAGARDEYLAAAQDSSSVDLQAAAMLGIGRAYLLEKNYGKAEEYLTAIINEHPKNQFIPHAYWFLYKLYKEEGQLAQAVESLEKYLALAPEELIPFVEQTLADEYLANNDLDKAIGAFRGALAAQPDNPDYFNLQLGKALQQKGEDKAAIDAFVAAVEGTTNPYVGAQANLLAGDSYTKMGFVEQAYTRYQDSVTRFPEAYDTYTALVRLTNANQPVDLYQRGMVDYYAKEYGLSAEAFSSYLTTTSNPNLDAYYFRALGFLEAGEPEKAIGDLKNLINTSPNSEHWTEAWFESAYIYWAYLDNFTAGAQTLLNFVAQNPQHPEAAKALFDAGRIYDRGKVAENAAETWARIIEEYPTDPIAPRAFLLSGVMYYRIREFAKAQDMFQRNITLSTTDQDKAAAMLWLGKTQTELGQKEEAVATWTEAAEIDPTAYYSIRAGQLAAGKPVLAVDENYSLGVDFISGRKEATRWFADTFAVSASTDLDTINALMADPLFRKAKAFWEIGEYQRARGYFESYRASIKDDLTKTYLLTNYSLDVGNYRTAIFGSKAILDAATAQNANLKLIPHYFNQIRFGPYYRETVLEYARMFNFNPLLLFSLIRQESFFEGFVSSSVGASGLMQLMPATAQELVNMYNWPTNYDQADLVKPAINVRLGTQYLSNQRDYFPNMYVALAAYNAGPGNAGIWNAIAKDDPDLFLETIRYDETRNYIMYITENLAMYNNLYRMP